MTYSLYDSWTIEDTNNIGQKFKAICLANRGYENHLTVGKVYTIYISARILPMSPLCELIGDTGKNVECHLTRFEKEAQLWKLGAYY